ncbi:MAG: EAL domain-containing protein [Amphritea sp.]
MLKETSRNDLFARQDSVLIVEDTLDDIALLSQQLSQKGYKLHVATSGAIALEWISKHRPDLILLDINLPDIDGCNLCRQIKEVDSLASVPVVFMTAFNDQEHKVKGFEAGGVDYITKPFNEAEVMQRVQTHLDLNRQTEELKGARAVLETRVRQRTQELEDANKKLLANAAKYRRLIESIEQDHFVYSRSRDKTFDYLSESVFDITGYSEEEFSDLYSHLIHSQSAEWNPCEWPKNSTHPRSETPFTIRIKNKQNTLQYLEIMETPVFHDGDIIAVEGIARDITRRKLAEDELRLAASVFKTSTDGIMITDVNGKIIRINTAFSKITGFTAEETLGRTPHLLQDGLQEDVFIDNLWSEISEKGEWEGEVWNRRKEGEAYPVWLKVSAIKDEGGKVIQHVSIFTDISEKKESQNKIYYMAHYDVLTQLPNRQLFQDRGQRTIKKSKRGRGRACIIFVDVDNFKIINDTMGHSIGDRVLRVVADRLKSLVREEDTVARLGGDEFVILLDSVENSQHVGRIAEKIGAAFVEPFLINGREHRISVSMGISLYPQDGEDIETLVKHADAAMYNAKKAGRNTYRYYTKNLTIMALHRLETENALHHALKNNEFELFYQPQISFETNQITGVEALIRWHHPEKGLLGPVEFIPIAEESHLIIDIGEWVIQEAIKTLSSWREISLNVPRVAINVAGKQLQSSNMINLIKNMLGQFGVSPNHLQLEITESILVPQGLLGSNKAIAQLEAYRDMGGSVAIDDFGTGFSSLNYLKRFPVDTLKIDRSFVEGLVDNSDDRAIAQTIITLGKTLGLAVMAEGVETEQQEGVLRGLGCHKAQGYLYAKPMAEPELKRFLSDYDKKITTDG